MFMKTYTEQIIIKKWLPLLEEYDLVKAKKSEHFTRVKDLLSAYHVTQRDLYKYHRRWVEAGREVNALLPKKRGPRHCPRRTPKPIERAMMKAYRKIGCNSYEMVLLFKPYYGTQTPCSRTIDRIKKRYPLNKKQKETIKRYERSYPGELGHTDLYYLPREISPDRQRYLAALTDDCTRLGYTEVLEDKKGETVEWFIVRALSWFLQVYGIRYDVILSDNGSEFKGDAGHPVEQLLQRVGITHYYNRPGHPQTNGKVEAFFKIVQNELVRAAPFDNLKHFKEQLGNYLYEYNHMRRHGGIEYMAPFEKFEKVTKLLS
jgi:hypothetical protein